MSLNYTHFPVLTLKKKKKMFVENNNEFVRSTIKCMNLHKNFDHFIHIMNSSNGYKFENYSEIDLMELICNLFDQKKWDCLSYLWKIQILICGKSLPSFLSYHYPNDQLCFDLLKNNISYHSKEYDDKCRKGIVKTFMDTFTNESFLPFSKELLQFDRNQDLLGSYFLICTDQSIDHEKWLNSYLENGYKFEKNCYTKDFGFYAQTEDLSKIKFLVENGFDINSQDKNGNTLLHCYINSDCKDIIEYLYNHSDTELLNNEDQTALDLCKNKDLIESFTDPNERKYQEFLQKKDGYVQRLNEILKELDELKNKNQLFLEEDKMKADKLIDIAQKTLEIIQI